MSEQSEAARMNGTSQSAGWVRPTTKGELRDRLKDGETCEVATMAAEMAAIGLRGWLEFDAFTMRPSDNAGWTLFEPNK